MILPAIRKNLREGKTFLSFTILRTTATGFVFLIPLITAKILTPTEFGSYSLSLIIIYLFTALLVQSSQKPFIIYATQELKETGKINKSFGARLLLLIPAVALFLLAVFFFEKTITGFAFISREQLIFLSAAYFGIIIRYSVETIFRALNKRVLSALYDMTVGIISTAYLVGGSIITDLSLEHVFLVFLIGPLLAVPFFLRQLEITKLLPLAFDRQLFREIFDYTKWASIGGAALYLTNWGDNLVLRYFVSVEEIGNYNLGYQVFKGVAILFGAIGVYFLPFLAQNLADPQKIRAYLYEKRPKILFLGITSLALFYFILPLLFTAAYGETYSGAIRITQILLIGSIFIFYRLFYGTLFDAMRKYRFVQISSVIFVIINLALDIPLVITFGIAGAAIATTTTFITSAIVYEIYFRTRCKKLLLNFSSPNR